MFIMFIKGMSGLHPDFIPKHIQLQSKSVVKVAKGLI